MYVIFDVWQYGRNMHIEKSYSNGTGDIDTVKESFAFKFSFLSNENS